MIYDNMADLIGNTPVVKYQGLYLKLESFNPSGSVKDRPMEMMIKSLEECGKITKGDILVEATSGNMGISLAFLAPILGYKAVIIMPDNMSSERTKIIKALGATIIHTPAAEKMVGAINKAKELSKTKGYFYLDQFNNPANPLAHSKGTAKEIMKDFDNLDYFISSIGTAGTITGTAKVLKDHYKAIKVIGVEPLESAVINGHPAGVHLIQGIGAGFYPPLLDLSLIDEVKMVSSNEAINEMKELWREGIFVGISSASSINVAKQIRNDNPNATILVIIPDGGFKYLSVEV